MDAKPQGWGAHHLPLVLLVLTMFAVLVGGSVRIYDAGESCPDWPKCFGTWSFDVSEEDQTTWWEEHPDEVDSRGEHHRYSTFEIFLEWFHRLVTGLLLGPLCIVQAALAFRRRKVAPAPWRASSLALVLVIVQGAFGAATVRYDNIPWSVAIHLVFALLLALSLLWAWLTWAASVNALPAWCNVGMRHRRKMRHLSSATLGVLVLGALIASTEQANTACGVGWAAWPLCHGGLLPVMTAWETQLQMAHRLAVLAVLVLLVQHVRSFDGPAVLLRLSKAATHIFVANLLVGGLYLVTWDPSTAFIEGLSLVHLMLGSASFLCLAFAALLCQHSTSDESE